MHIAFGVEARPLLQAQVHEREIDHHFPDLNPRQGTFNALKSWHRTVDRGARIIEGGDQGNIADPSIVCASYTSP